MIKVAFIGAGSFVFTRNLVRDILTFPLMEDATIALMDIDKERLEFAVSAVQKIIDQGQYPAKIEATMNREEALEGADAVICTILLYGVDVWRHDVEIPKQYGVDVCIGDTRGPSGIFRALRTIPVMQDICHDMERLCPDAILLNYANPMAMVCRAIQQNTKINVTGLCHSVQETAAKLAKWIDKPINEIDYLCAGINHQAWYLKYQWQGTDAYPLIREAINAPEIYNDDIVRNEMLQHLGYYVTESSHHNSEYNPWFRKRPDLLDKYCNTPRMKYGASMKAHIRMKENWDKMVEEWFAKEDSIDLKRGYEYAAYLINAYIGGEPYIVNGNVPNTGLITNLPNNACVEIPVLIKRHSIYPMYVGALPPQLAALNNINVAVEEMAVEAALTGDPKMVLFACTYDPLTSAVCSLGEIKEMVQVMLKHNEPYLPQFKTLAL